MVPDWSDGRQGGYLVCRRFYEYENEIDMSAKDTQKRPRGRPKIDSEPIRLRLSRAELERLDAWIAAQPEPRPTRQDAIRHLLDDDSEAQQPGSGHGAEPTLAGLIARIRDNKRTAPNNDTIKPKKGRPPVDTMPVNVRLSAETIAALDVLRRESPDLPTRPQLIRRIVEEYLRERQR